MKKDALDRAVKGVLEFTIDASSWTVDEDRILRHYREFDVHIASINDIEERASLRDMDRHAVGLAKG